MYELWCLFPLQVEFQSSIQLICSVHLTLLRCSRKRCSRRWQVRLFLDSMSCGGLVVCICALSGRWPACCLCLSLSVSLSVSLPLFFSVSISDSLCISCLFLSISLSCSVFVCLSLCLSVCLPVYLCFSITFSLSLSLHLSAFASAVVCLSLCLSISLFVPLCVSCCFCVSLFYLSCLCIFLSQMFHSILDFEEELHKEHLDPSSVGIPSRWSTSCDNELWYLLPSIYLACSGKRRRKSPLTIKQQNLAEMPIRCKIFVFGVYQ